MKSPTASLCLLCLRPLLRDCLPRIARSFLSNPISSLFQRYFSQEAVAQLKTLDDGKYFFTLVCSKEIAPTASSALEVLQNVVAEINRCLPKYADVSYTGPYGLSHGSGSIAVTTVKCNILFGMLMDIYQALLCTSSPPAECPPIAMGGSLDTGFIPQILKVLVHEAHASSKGAR